MADDASTENEILQPLDASELLKGLQLTTGKAAQFAGVSRRQLCYWTDTGIINSLEGDAQEEGDGEDNSSRRTYDFESLHKVLLIKQALEQSSGLRRAAREVDRHIADRRRKAEELLASIEQKREEFLTEQADRLTNILEQVQQLLPKIKSRERLLELYSALEWLDRISDNVQSGKLLLEEDADACLKLASMIDQAEAKLSTLGQVEIQEVAAKQ